MSKKKNLSEAMADASGPGWGWIAYSSGITAAILLSDLPQVCSPTSILYLFGMWVGGKFRFL